MESTPGVPSSASASVPASTSASSSATHGVADYFTVLGVGEKLVWQHQRKKHGIVATKTIAEEEQEEEENEAALMERFYREIVEVAIIVTTQQHTYAASDIDSKGHSASISQVPSYADDATTASSHANSVSSAHSNTYSNSNLHAHVYADSHVNTPIGKPRHSVHFPHSPPSSDVATTITLPESTSGRMSRRDLDGFTTIHHTCPAGKSSKQQHQNQTSVTAARTGVTANEAPIQNQAIWSKSETFDADLDPCYGFRREVFSRVETQDSQHTPLKQIGRKVGNKLRHQLGPLLPSRDRKRGSSSYKYHLAFRQRGPDERDQPAIADLDLRYVRIHRDSVPSVSIKPVDTMSDTMSTSTKSTVLRRGLATGANIAARVAEASKQKLIEKYRERYENAPASGNVSHVNYRDAMETGQTDTILVALEELLEIPDGFDQWSIPEQFRWIQIPSKARGDSKTDSSSIAGSRKTHVFPYKISGHPGIESVLSEDTGVATQASDPSGAGVEAYFDGASFVLTPPSSSAGASDIEMARPHVSPAVVVTGHNEQELTTSFEVLDPIAFMPKLLEICDLPNLLEVASTDPYIYIPIMAYRRQRVGDEERYHEDPAVVNLAVSFRDFGGEPILPDLLDIDDDEDEDGFNPLSTTPWAGTVETVKQRPRVSHPMRMLGAPVVLVRRNHPVGFADAAFATRVLDRFPLKNYKGLPLPEEELPMFCYPTGCRLHRARYSDCPLPQYFGFVVKNEQGDSIYVSCVSFMEPLSNIKLDQLNGISQRRRRVSLPHRRFAHRQERRNASTSFQQERGAQIEVLDDDDDLLTGFDEMTTFENKTICLVSRYPFWTAYRRFLSHLHVMSGSPSDLPVERYVSHLLLSVPLPKPGGPCILVPLPALNCPMILSTPPTKDLPLLDLPFQRLFACLDVPTVVTIVIGLLSLESKLLLISTRPSLVLDVCELLKALLFPFELCAPYVPRLTEPFMSCLDFPGAIFVGIHDDGRKDGLAAMVRTTLPEDSTIVDLDTGEIDCSGDRYTILSNIWRTIPSGPRSMLISEIETLCRDAGIVPGQEPLDSQIDAAFGVSVAAATLIEDINDSGDHAEREPLDDRAIRDAFLRFFTSTLAGYERFLIPPDLDFQTSGSEWFDTQGFLSAASQEQAPFLGSLVSTQLFQLFVQRRTESSDVHCLLFDECLVEYHSSPVPYGRLGGDVETIPSVTDGPPQMLYSLLVDQCCTESPQQSRGGSFDYGGDGNDAVNTTAINSLHLRMAASSESFVNDDGDLVTTPSGANLSQASRFVYFSDGNPCFPQTLNVEYFLPREPDSLLVEISETPLPLLTRSEREVEEALRRRKTATSYRGLRNQSRCMWQLPKLMGSHFLGSWLLCIPSQVSQNGLSTDSQSRYVLRALGAMRLLRNKQRVIPDEASYRAMMVACGCAATDRRVELTKLFGLMRADGIFPSAVTLGQYTRALAEGYSKRSTELANNSSSPGVEVTVAGSSTEVQRQGKQDTTILNSLDGDIATLEESGRRWRSRLSQNRTRDHQTDADADADISVSQSAREEHARSSRPGKEKRKRRSVHKAWHPVTISSSFVPFRENQSRESKNLVDCVSVVALWSRTTPCGGCSYIPLDEEIQSGWDVVGSEGDSWSVIACPRCDSQIVPRLGYREMRLDEALRRKADLDGGDGAHPDQLPAQLIPSEGDFDDAFVTYMSPVAMRSRLERHVEEHGESVLDRETLFQLDPELFYNFWWYCARFSMPLPLPIAACKEPQHKCAFVAWDKNTSKYGCRTAAEVMTRVFSGMHEQTSNPDNFDCEPDVMDEDYPLLSQFKLQNLSKGDWDHEDLSKILVTLVEACDKRDFKPVIECTLRCIKRKRDLIPKAVQTKPSLELECYHTILYLAKYQCTTAFHVFFPAAAKPCKGYHFWCAFGTPLPIFDRMFRDALKRIKEHEHLIIPVHVVSDIALGFRCVFGHII